MGRVYDEFANMQEQLSQESSMSELGLGKTVELSVSGKIIGVEVDSYIPDRLLYRVELRDSRGVFLSTVQVIDEMVVRIGK